MPEPAQPPTAAPSPVAAVAAEETARPARPVVPTPSNPPGPASTPTPSSHRPNFGRLTSSPFARPTVQVTDGTPLKQPEFKVGDKCVHPAHGVGEVTTIEERAIGGTTGMFYILKLHNGMKVMVPVGAAAQVGLRPIMSDKEADAVLDTMRAREVAVDLHPWSRRFRAYTEMIKSGSAYEIAKVLRDMYRLKFDKELSFGERRLLDQAKGLLMKELAYAKKVPEAKMSEEVAKMFTA
ncbi:hypothetical protein LZC95_36210 [Pendulispora brunnea]|uniref:CarD-like/TRCF RNAP-interacting domain-containing protein n=1 Tax=Pendulispora brunnea TaxID=2905690 RepID=A0ABZ2K516_9BACT